MQADHATILIGPWTFCTYQPTVGLPFKFQESNGLLYQFESIVCKFINWIKEISTTLPMEKITYIIKGKLSLFQNIWGPFMEYMESVDLSNVGNEADEA